MNTCLASGVLGGAFVSRAQEKARGLYLLAVPSGADPSACALYRLGPDGKLATARTLFHGHDGMVRVTTSQDALFLVYASQGAEVLSVVHKGAPLQADDVSLAGRGAAAAGQPAALPLVTAHEKASGALDLIAGTPAGQLLSVGTSASETPRVQPANMETFSLVEYPGAAATRVPEDSPTAWAQGGTLAGASHANLVFDTQLPRNLRLNPRKDGPAYTTVVASSNHYLVLLEEPAVAVPPRADTSLYVHDRERKTWGEIRLDGSNDSSIRLFGDWLAVRVELSTDLTGVQSSAVVASTKAHAASDHLTNYPRSYFPGYALLHNLQTGREVRIKTGFADTEVEGISGETVIYRVGQKLYRGRVEGKSVLDSEQIADDPAVANVHWIFPDLFSE